MAVVLVVDDGAANRELIQAYLSGIDCEVRFAVDGLSALSAIESDAPDLVLLDVQMPGVDGYEVCRRIKRVRSDQPIMICSAAIMSDNEEALLAMGIEQFLTKPYHPLELLERISREMSRGRCLEGDEDGRAIPGPIWRVAVSRSSSPIRSYPGQATSVGLR